MLRFPISNQSEELRPNVADLRRVPLPEVAILCCIYSIQEELDPLPIASVRGVAAAAPPSHGSCRDANCFSHRRDG
jgi:hypothetical protein